MNRALELAPDLVEARIARGYVNYWVVNDPRGALRELESIDQTQPDPEFFWIKGSVQRRLLQFDAATESFQRAIELDPTVPIYQIELAVNYNYSGDPASAERQYQAALELSPDWIGARWALALFYYFKGHDERANRLLLDGVEINGVETIVAMLVGPSLPPRIGVGRSLLPGRARLAQLNGRTVRPRFLSHCQGLPVSRVGCDACPCPPRFRRA